MWVPRLPAQPLAHRSGRPASPSRSSWVITSSTVIGLPRCRASSRTTASAIGDRARRCLRYDCAANGGQESVAGDVRKPSDFLRSGEPGGPHRKGCDAHDGLDHDRRTAAPHAGRRQGPDVSRVAPGADVSAGWTGSAACLLLACWLWLFAWPRFLVPPHLRGQPGWVTASWRMWRADRPEARERRVAPRREAGEHARRSGARPLRQRPHLGSWVYLSAADRCVPSTLGPPLSWRMCTNSLSASALSSDTLRPHPPIHSSSRPMNNPRPSSGSVSPR